MKLTVPVSSTRGHEHWHAFAMRSILLHAGVSGQTSTATRQVGRIRRADGMSRDPANAGAVAFKRAGDPNVGEFSDAVVLKKFGDVPADLSAVAILVLLLRDDREPRLFALSSPRSCSFRQLPRLRRSHRVLPQCSDSVAMGGYGCMDGARGARGI